MASNLPQTFVKGFHNEQELKKMVYCHLGTTDVKLSKLGIGGASLGSLFGKIDKQEAITFVREGIKNGLNYIDTSPFYGDTTSETLVGKCLAGIPREAYYISTKVGRYGTNWANYFDHSGERILKEFEKSLERLGVDYVDILFVHDIEFSPMEQILTEALPAVQKLKESKKARYIGVSGYPISVLKEAVEKSSVQIDVIITYARDCLFDSTAGSFKEFFKSHNVSLINASLTAMGLLTNHGPQPWHPAAQNIKDICQQARSYCQEKGVEFGRLAIYEAMQRPGYSSHLVGMVTSAELQCNVDLVTNGLTSSEKQVLQEVKLKFFNTGENFHWEGVEIAAMKKYLEENKLK